MSKRFRFLAIGTAIAIMSVTILGSFTFNEGGPDFKVVSLNVAPSEVVPGEPTTVEVEVANVGKAEGSGEIILEVDGSVHDKMFVSLAPGENVTKNLWIATRTLGQHVVSVGGKSETFRVQYDWVVVEPEEYPHAIRNPLKGFRGRGTSEYITVFKDFIEWDQIENSVEDGIERIKSYCNRAWIGVENRNEKVIPHVYLEWPDKGQYWPADMEAGDYSSDQFVQRVKRLVKRLGQVWDADPRVAWIEMGIIGYWGEHHDPSPTEEMQMILGEAFSSAFPNKKVLVRHPWEFTGYKFGIYWASWAHIDQVGKHGGGIAKLNEEWGMWKSAVIEGETAYNWGRYHIQPGDDPNDTLSDPFHREWLIDTICWLHCTALGWVSAYDPTNENVREGAEEVQCALGYRFVLENVVYPRKVMPSVPFRVCFTVRNEGSAPFYYDWPVELSLLNPENKDVVWRDTFENVDIRTWLPGDNWNFGADRYENGAKSYVVEGFFQVGADTVTVQLTVTDDDGTTGTAKTTVTILENVGEGIYILALSILDPAGMLPSARFATKNYFTGGRHPIGYIGVGQEVTDPIIDPVMFDNLGGDLSLHYCLSEEDNDPPRKPNGLTITKVTSSQIDLDWGDNPEDDLHYYWVYRSTSSDFACDDLYTFLDVSTSSQYSDTSVSENTTYYYKVTAGDKSGNESGASEEVSATTQ